jgi:cardiolipin synthase A/B
MKMSATPRAIVIDKPARRLAQQALSRAAGAPLLGGNAVDLLIDARVNYDAWLAALRGAQKRILLENYIIRDDAVGREFLAVLVERAEAGVRVHVICDWMGCLGQSGAAFWQPLVDAGGGVRRYNPLQWQYPFGWINRDHRKLLVVDRDVAFLGGVCISAKWLGEAARGVPPWRDTAVAIRGPALLELEQAFADVWSQLGAELPMVEQEEPAAAGNMDVRIVATQPDTAGMFRLDQLIAGLAQRTLWLADAYFVGLSPYVQALGAAARDGVDVRLLVPGASDLPVVRAMSRAGYRPLLEKGIRVYEWNGSMMHSKTAVADGRWARVGSSNLNVASWLGNCELDVAVEDTGFAQKMEEQYLHDLEQSTEVVLASRRIRCPHTTRVRHAGGSSSRATASALRLAHSVGAAFSRPRTLAPNESASLAWVAGLLCLFTVVGVVWPWLIAWPLAALTAWMGVATLARYIRTRAKRQPAVAAAVPRSEAAKVTESH